MAKAIADVINEATKLVANVPEPLREVAFSKAFDALLTQQSHGQPPKPRTHAKPASNSVNKGTSVSTREALDQLDRTSYPEINVQGSSLTNALRVLLAAKDDLGVDGLSASSIRHVLVDKFRVKVTRQAVSQALNSAGALVNRHNDGGEVIFRIMGRGEQTLKEAATGDGDAPPRPPRKRGTATKSATDNTSKSNSAKASKPNGKPKPQRSAGPQAELVKLFDSGFFSKPRSIGNIIEHLKHNLGRTFKASEMSPGLLRLLRSKKLKRTKNKDNQYEYQNA